MWKKVNSLSLPFLIMGVSLISILIIFKTAQAQWLAPGDNPGDASPPGIVLNPMVADLDLNNWNIKDDAFSTLSSKSGMIDLRTSANGKAALYGESASNSGYGVYGKNTGSGYAGYFSGNVHITGNLTVDGTVPSGGSGGGDSLWTGGANETGRIYYTTTTDAGTAMDEKVGIGTSAPDHTLVLSTAGSTTNAELNIQTNSLNHWAIYHDNDTEDLRFWNSDVSAEPNLLTLKNNGLVGIGNSSPSAKLEVRNSGTEDILNLFDNGSEKFTVLDGGNVGIANTAPTSTLAVAGNFNVQNSSTYNSTLFVSGGTGNVGIGTTNPAAKLDVISAGGSYGIQTSGAVLGLSANASIYGVIVTGGTSGIYAYSTGAGKAATFAGPVDIIGNLTMTGNISFTNGYLNIPVKVGGAPVGACIAGQMILDTDNNRLYVCSGNIAGPSWKYVTLN